MGEPGSGFRAGLAWMVLSMLGLGEAVEARPLAGDGLRAATCTESPPRRLSNPFFASHRFRIGLLNVNIFRLGRSPLGCLEWILGRLATGEAPSSPFTLSGRGRLWFLWRLSGLDWEAVGVARPTILTGVCATIESPSGGGTAAAAGGMDSALGVGTTTESFRTGMVGFAWEATGLAVGRAVGFPGMAGLAVLILGFTMTRFGSTTTLAAISGAGATGVAIGAIGATMGATTAGGGGGGGGASITACFFGNT